MSNIVYVTDADFESVVLNATVPVLLDFWAEWCGPCRAIAPVLEELAEEYQGRAMIAKINIDENQQVPVQFAIRSIPTLMIFKNGKVENTQVGAGGKSQLINMLDAVL